MKKVVSIVLNRYHAPVQDDDFEMVERLTSLLRVETRKVVAKAGLQLVHYEVLDYLGRANRYSNTLAALTDYLGLTKGTMSQTIKLLTGKGLIEKKTDQKDRRMTHLYLSKDGKEVLICIQNGVRHLTDSVKIGKIYKKALDTVMKDILWQIQDQHGGKTFGLCGTCRFNRKISDTTFRCGLTKESLTLEETKKICRKHEYVA